MCWEGGRRECERRLGEVEDEVGEEEEEEEGKRTEKTYAIAGSLTKESFVSHQ